MIPVFDSIKIRSEEMQPHAHEEEGISVPSGSYHLTYVLTRLGTMLQGDVAKRVAGFWDFGPQVRGLFLRPEDVITNQSRSP
jgi:hypothetical protein